MTDGRPDDGLGANGGTGLDVTRPHSARVWNYWVGGKDNFAAEQVAAAHPDVRLAVRRSGRSWPGGGVPGHACGRCPPPSGGGQGLPVGFVAALLLELMLYIPGLVYIAEASARLLFKNGVDIKAAAQIDAEPTAHTPEL